MIRGGGKTAETTTGHEAAEECHPEAYSPKDLGTGISAILQPEILRRSTGSG